MHLFLIVKYLFIGAHKHDTKMQVTNSDQLNTEEGQSSSVNDSQYDNLLVTNKGNLKF